VISANILNHDSFIIFMFALYHVVSLYLNRVQFHHTQDEDLVEGYITSCEDLIYESCKQAENY
jgi:hypothetical protein